MLKPKKSYIGIIRDINLRKINYRLPMTSTSNVAQIKIKFAP